MSILIKGMEMPKSCESCPCKTTDAFGGLGCQATGYIPLRKVNQDRPDNCPLIPVPPHGRLIDEKDICDKIQLLIETPYCYNRLQVISEILGSCIQIVRDAPTIIPAIEEEMK